MTVIVERYCNLYPALTPRELPVAIDTLHMLTSFETFHALSQNKRPMEDVVDVIRKMAQLAIRFTPRFVGR